MRRATSQQFDRTGARHPGNDRHFGGNEHDAGDAAAQADPVPDELINKILQAAQWAPSSGDTPRWRFVLVRDPEIKK
jgi:nitroreductase